jgi:chromosome segregation ATPase
MNNLSAFTDVINGIRQAIFSLNNQIIQLRNQLDAVSNKEHQLSDVQDVKSALTDLKQSTDTKFNNLSSLVDDIEKLKVSLAEIDIKVTNSLCNCNSLITESDVQNMINKSISQLFEGVQPLSPLLKDNLETLPNTETLTVIVEPPVIVVPEEPSNVVPATKTTKKTSRKKS